MVMFRRFLLETVLLQLTGAEEDADKCGGTEGLLLLHLNNCLIDLDIVFLCNIQGGGVLSWLYTVTSHFSDMIYSAFKPPSDQTRL